MRHYGLTQFAPSTNSQKKRLQLINFKLLVELSESSPKCSTWQALKMTPKLPLKTNYQWWFM